MIRFWEFIRRWIRYLRELIRRLFEWLAEQGGGGGGTIDDDKCCELATETECYYLGSKSNFGCPEGYHRQWWYCCEGTQQVGCGECTDSETTCWGEDFQCSIWWWTGRLC